MSGAAPSRDAGRLFAYGTLMEPAVLRAVCGAAPEGVPATLAGYACFLVRDEVFPGIVPAPGAVTDGLLLGPLSPAAWVRIDAFESDFYARTGVTVLAGDGRRRVAADTYVVCAEHRHLLTDRPWDPERFASEHLGAYLERYG